MSSNNQAHAGVVTRFAPSPTGYMTIGNYRTALFSYLYALKHKGRFLLRIEDTDLERSQTHYTEQLMVDLQKMGTVFDEQSIWHQSQRTGVYEDYYQQLIKQGRVYSCYCSQEELALERKIQLAQGQPPRYSGRCRHLTKEQQADKIAQGIKPVLRFFVGQEAIHFVDAIMGPKEFSAQDIGDFIIKKTDGQATFFFCNAIDDALSGVTHVLRGDDHLTNTPRQILLLKALGLPIPQYGHFPLILGYDHKPLSKRTGSRSIKELLEDGYLPVALNNYLGRLGHHLTSSELLSIEQLAESFDFNHIAHGAAHYDINQLEYWQRQAFAHVSVEETEAILAPYKELIRDLNAFWSLVHPNISKASEVAQWVDCLHQPQQQIEAKDIQAYQWTVEHLAIALERWGEPWTNLTQALKAKGLKGKDLFMPLRLLMTGLHDGPPLEAVYMYIDREIMATRLQETIDGFKAL